MPMLGRTVEMHKRSVKRFIHASTVELTIVLPVPKVATSVNPLFGDLTRTTNTAGEVKGPYSCVWYDAYSARTMGKENSSGIETVIQSTPGQFRDATAFAEVWLQEVLLDQNNPAGQTWFDKALFVECQGKRYDVIGYVKLGLSVSTPYSAVVGLKGMLGYDNNT